MASVNQLQVVSTSYRGGMDALYFNNPSSSVTFTITDGGLYAIFSLADKANGVYARSEAYPFTTDEKYMLPGTSTWTPDDFAGKLIAGVQFRAANDTQPPVVSITG